MTKADLRTYMLQLLDDPFGSYFNTAFSDLALNIGQEEVQKSLIMAGELYYVKVVTALTVTNQADYIWPTDLLKVHKLELVTSGVSPNENIQVLMPITLNQMYAFGQITGTPSNYVLMKDRFTLYPIPDTPNLTVRLYYSYKVAALTSDSQVPDIPEQYQKVIAAYAARQGKVKDDASMANINALIAPFEQEMNQLAQDREYQTPRRVKETDIYYSSGW